MPPRGEGSDQPQDARGPRRGREGRREGACGVGLRSGREASGEPRAALAGLLACDRGAAVRRVSVRGRVPPARRVDAGDLRRDGADQHGRRRRRHELVGGARAGGHRGRPGGDPRGAVDARGDGACGACGARGERVVSPGAHLRDRLEPSGGARDACASPGGAVVGARDGDARGRDPRGVRVRRRRRVGTCADGCVRAAVVWSLGGVGAVRRDVSGGGA